MKLKPLYCSWFAVVSALIASMSWATPPTIANVTARQRFPWNGLVDIDVRFLCESNDLAKVFCTFAATNNATGVAIPIGRITRNGDDSGSGSTWTRKLIWDAKADVGAVKIDDVALTVDAKPIGVQLWENGPYWAECNVGATKPEEYGHYF